MNLLSVGGTYAPKRASRTDRYWAAEEDPRHLMEALNTKRERFWQLLEEMGIVHGVYKLWRFYHGLFYDTEGVSIVLGGEEYDISQLGVNEFRARLRLLLSLTTTEFDWDAQGTDDSQDTLEAIKMANAIEDWVMDEPRYTMAEALAAMKEQALVYRVGYVATIWDPSLGEQIGGDPETLEYTYTGDMSVFNPTLFDVIFNPTLPHRKRTWVLFRERRNRFDLAEQHFSKRQEILGTSDRHEGTARFYGMERGLVASEEHDEDTVDKWWFFHLPTPALTAGRMMCYTGDVVLYDGAFPPFYGYTSPRLPLARCVHSRMEGTDLIGHSPAVDLAPLQEALNIQLTTLLTNHRKFGQVKLWQQPGDNTEPQMLEPGTMILKSMSEVKVLDLLKTSPELLQLVDVILGRMDSVSGVSAASRGLADKEVPGIRAALDDQKTIQSNSDFDRNIRMAAQDVGQTVLEMWQHHAAFAREIPVVSEDDQIRLEKFTSDQLKRVRRMLVKPGNPALRTPSGRMQLVEYLMKLPDGIANRHELLSVIQGAPLKRVIAPAESQIRLAREENVKLRHGEQVVGSISDNHLVHLITLAELIGSSEARMNEALVMNAMPHLLWHLNYLTKNPMAQGLMLALGWADPQQIMALAQLGSFMAPMESSMPVPTTPRPQGLEETGRRRASVLPGPGSPSYQGGPVGQAQTALKAARVHLKGEGGAAARGGA